MKVLNTGNVCQFATFYLVLFFPLCVFADYDERDALIGTAL